jgi:hypothetical protein
MPPSATDDDDVMSTVCDLFADLRKMHVHGLSVGTGRRQGDGADVFLPHVRTWSHKPGSHYKSWRPCPDEQ